MWLAIHERIHSLQNAVPVLAVRSYRKGKTHQTFRLTEPGSGCPRHRLHTYFLPLLPASLLTWYRLLSCGNVPTRPPDFTATSGWLLHVKITSFITRFIPTLLQFKNSDKTSNSKCPEVARENPAAHGLLGKLIVKKESDVALRGSVEEDLLLQWLDRAHYDNDYRTPFFTPTKFVLQLQSH